MTSCPPWDMVGIEAIWIILFDPSAPFRGLYTVDWEISSILKLIRFRRYCKPKYDLQRLYVPLEFLQQFDK